MFRAVLKSRWHMFVLDAGAAMAQKASAATHPNPVRSEESFLFNARETAATAAALQTTIQTLNWYADISAPDSADPPPDGYLFRLTLTQPS